MIEGDYHCRSQKLCRQEGGLSFPVLELTCKMVLITQSRGNIACNPETTEHKKEGIHCQKEFGRIS